MYLVEIVEQISIVGTAFFFLSSFFRSIGKKVNQIVGSQFIDTNLEQELIRIKETLYGITKFNCFVGNKQ